MFDRWKRGNSEALFLGLEPFWSGAGSIKDPGAAGEGALACLEEHLIA